MLVQKDVALKKFRFKKLFGFKKFLGLCEANVLNLGLQLYLEPFEIFSSVVVYVESDFSFLLWAKFYVWFKLRPKLNNIFRFTYSFNLDKKPSTSLTQALSLSGVWHLRPKSCWFVDSWSWLYFLYLNMEACCTFILKILFPVWK